MLFGTQREGWSIVRGTHRWEKWTTVVTTARKVWRQVMGLSYPTSKTTNGATRTGTNDSDSVRTATMPDGSHRRVERLARNRQ